MLPDIEKITLLMEEHTHTDTLTEKPDLGLMVHISFSPEEKLHNLVMAFLTCNIQCCLAILYM